MSTKPSTLKELPERGGLFSQPKAVWAVAFACVISFMGLGLVDPILPAIANQLHASKSQVSLLFTSYNLVTGLAMLITGFVSSRIGVKWTLLSGILLIIVFSALGGASDTIAQIVGFRGGWGFGNALFIATALSAIVGLSTSGTAKAIILYEAALGLGISVGPLLGGELGSISWRGPFFGVSVLMVIGFLFILFVLPKIPKPTKRSSLADPFKALSYPALKTLAIVAFLYNFGFFTLMAYSPYVMGLDEHGLGYVFFGWGILLAFTSVFVAPKLQSRFNLAASMGVMLTLFTIDLLVMGIGTFMGSPTTVIVAVIVAGIFLGINNTLITTAVMESAPVERSVASASYSFVRFLGGAASPWLAGKLSEWYNAQMPFYFGALMVFIGVIVLIVRRRHLRDIDVSHAH
ncbi:MFS transporter [Paenibacillus sp. PK4536]|jgi:ACDE family multidrug resistance protein|uniref:Multidrug efflux protein YfmO n=1 Tax=Paenibacillus nuruki TaxID=1886670 RepID=A0A1E3KZS0_9BACL|nr:MULTISPECIES: MFS transporter [Paenibacillus]ODP26425.1 Multidrug efflux protein YfmO [Paenibacillus nuruki]TKJ84130.1 MFS transporter [Paenibacillus sp. CFBP13512]WIM40711.1 MFS transporter [Paenibacillus sp. PK4536]CAJ1316940.1 Multidrug efflux protein YfmO [Paenibacillus nuruki]